MPANCRELVILQNPHGFLIFTRENIDPCDTSPPPHHMSEAIPAISLTRPYGADSGKSVLEIVETFFSKKETPSS